MATKSMRAGNISASTAAHIKARARAKLHGGKGYDVNKSPAFAHAPEITAPRSGGAGIHFHAPGAHFPMTAHKRTRAHGNMDWNIRG